ncbi:rRNA pseudouridine synthase [Desulfovibrio sp. OttesenSCG-928-O18]|nr:rRNA pseudouridine synthase [Desulfovibrio sp. OttesenSCG-928-O18]
MKKQPPSSVSSDAGLRLNKAIAHSGLASRRAADAMIQEGRVTVNGETVTEPGTRIDPETDTVAVDGAPLALGAEKGKTYLLCNKPVQVVSTASDPQGRKTVLDLLPAQYARMRLYPVGRLDYFSEGLLLLTDDGELTLRLTHPRYHLPKRYHVTLREKPSPAMLETMRNGMTLAEGEKLAPVAVHFLQTQGNVLEMTLNQGINRQIRRMCRDLGLTVLRLLRVASGPLQLGSLPPGTVRELTPKELSVLKRAVGL